MSSFQAGNTKLERFLPKNQHAQSKLLNFENWCNQRFDIQSQFSKSKIIGIFLNFFSLMNTNLGAQFLIPFIFYNDAQFFTARLSTDSQNSIILLLIFRQKYFWFCIPRLKTQQTLLPYLIVNIIYNYLQLENTKFISDRKKAGVQE